MPEIVDVSFSAEVEEEIERYIYEQIEWLELEHRQLHETDIPRWRKLYSGIPAEENKSFPWPNASNTVVQVIGEAVDNAVARVQGLVWATHPVWAFQNYAKSPDRRKRELQRRALEDWMDIAANQPNFLDLYRVEGQWFTDIAKLGTAFVKVTHETTEEAVVVGYDSAAKKTAGKVKTLYDGPRVDKLRHEDVLADPRAQTVEKAEFISHRHSVHRHALEERAFFEIYDRKAVEKILETPDRSGPRNPERTELEDQGIIGTANSDHGEEWDIYECHFAWLHNKRKYRLIYSFHKESRTVLRKVFNFLPDHKPAIIRGKLGYREDGMYGSGYAKILERYQEEMSSIHNRRGDNATIANIRALRVSPRSRALDSNFELYPGALLVGEKDDIESIQVGDVYNSAYKDEEMTAMLVTSRTGITPAQSGGGTGAMQKKPAVYSAMGTLSVMQESNSRVGHATSEFRHCHVILGDTLASMYAHFGVHGADKLFGDNGKHLLAALKDYKDSRLYIPIRATTGSLNREIEKQNAMLMKQLQDKHFTGIAQMLQAMQSPQIPPDDKEKISLFIMASNALMQRIMKDFGYDQPDEYIPDIEPPKQIGAGNPAGQVAPGQSSMGGPAQTPPAGGGGVVPLPGGAGVPAGPPQSGLPTS